MTAFCIDHLRRLPCELHFPTSRLMAAMAAYGVIAEERQQKSEQELERARSWSSRGF